MQREFRRGGEGGVEVPIVAAHWESRRRTGNYAAIQALVRMEHSKMGNEPTPTISHNALVLIGDGQKALFLRNKGTAQQVRLEVEQILEQDNPATREQGTDRPGRSVSSVGTARSAVEEVDWHHLAKERFAGEIAEALYRQARDNRFDKLVVIAPAKILGNLRKAFHAEVTDRIIGEIPKELTSHPIPQIERLVAV